jgi:hypothetical protein
MKYQISKVKGMAGVIWRAIIQRETSATGRDTVGISHHGDGRVPDEEAG